MKDRKVADAVGSRVETRARASNRWSRNRTSAQQQRAIDAEGANDESAVIESFVALRTFVSVRAQDSVITLTGQAAGERREKRCRSRPRCSTIRLRSSRTRRATCSSPTAGTTPFAKSARTETSAPSPARPGLQEAATAPARHGSIPRAASPWRRTGIFIFLIPAITPSAGSLLPAAVTTFAGTGRAKRLHRRRGLDRAFQLAAWSR